MVHFWINFRWCLTFAETRRPNVMYKIERRDTEGFARWVREVAGDEEPDLQEALDAISQNPFNPDASRYLLDKPNDDLVGLQIYIPVYQIRIRQTGFKITYTVHEYQRLIRIADMEKGGWLYKLRFSPRLKDERPK